MKELLTNEMPNYLDQIIKTEISLYKLEEIKKKADKRLKQLENSLNRISTNPSRDSVRKPRYAPPAEPKKPADKKHHKTTMSDLGNHMTLFGWALEFGATASANRREEERYNREIAQYAIDLEKYKRDKQDYEARYAQEMEEYNRKVAEADQSDTQNKIELPLAIKRDTEARNIIAENIVATETALEQLYDMDIIFPKYRTLVAICSMYEYFVTGRVSQLKGADGAYNLYESELRQNLIIAQLDRIATKLDEIKENQYMLYSELKKANNYLSNIDNTLFKTLEVTQNIAESLEFSNCIQQAILRNTEAIKYISLING